MKNLEEKIKEVESIFSFGHDFKEYAREYYYDGCYVYAKVMSIIIPGTEIFVNSSYTHVICKYGDKTWDAVHKKGKINDEDSYIPLNHCYSNVFCLKNLGQGKNKLVNNLDEIIRVVYKYIDKYGDEDGKITERISKYRKFIKKNNFPVTNPKLNTRLSSLDIPEKYKEAIFDVEKCFADFDEEDLFSPFAYTHGGCYQYARVLKCVLGTPTLMLDIDIGHCFMKIGEEYVDSEGTVETEEYSFHEFENDSSDDDYCLEEFGYGDCERNIKKILTVTAKYIKIYCPSNKKKMVIKRTKEFIHNLEEYGLPSYESYFRV